MGGRVTDKRARICRKREKQELNQWNKWKRGNKERLKSEREADIKRAIIRK